jgi:serine/threonine protein kinase
MVTNFVQGGELFSVIHTPKSNGICEHSARFYAANIYEGLLHMHERRIVYRDLKPEVSCTLEAEDVKTKNVIFSAHAVPISVV